MRRLLVTGGAGFIGSAFVRHALAVQPNVMVVNLDALTYAGHRSTLTGVLEDPRHTLVHGDVRDEALVATLVAEVDAVVHFAAESHVDRSIAAPGTFLSTNVLGSGVVFEACRRAGVARVLHVSTDEVYGPVEPPRRARETDALLPSSPYAASKAAADLLASSYARTYGFPVTVTRSTNTFGPFQLPEKLIPRFVTRLLDGGQVPLYGAGDQERDWLHVDDHVAALWLVLERGRPGGVYNIGADNHHSNRAVTEAVLAHLGLGADRIDHVADRPGHDRRYAVDSSRLRALGWRPQRDFAAALAVTIDWYREHEDWWRPLLGDATADGEDPGGFGPAAGSA